MGQSAETGYYTLKTSSNKCLTNPTGNSVSVITCDQNDPRTIWKYDNSNKSICNKQSKNCLDNGMKGLTDHTVAAYPLSTEDTRKWTYNAKPGWEAVTGGTLCNIGTGMCLENGGPSSKGLAVAAYNDDKNNNKVWFANKATCIDATFSEPAKIMLTPTNQKTVCPDVCDKKGKEWTYTGVPVYGNTAAASKCNCAKWGACKM